jgi:hypothetical protein
MQDELNALYEARFRGRRSDGSAVYTRLRGPDFVWVAPAYMTAKPRVLFIGQQPDGCDFSYAEFLSAWTVAAAVEGYRQFNFGEYYNASPWWTFYNQLRFALFGPKCDRGVVGWINLLKFVTVDRESVLGMPFEGTALGLQGDLFLQELVILEPDACIFATGPDYDRIIDRYYPGVAFEECGLDLRTMARLKHNSLPARSFRTYHPKALRLLKKWDAVFTTLCAHIKNDAL